MEKQNLIDFKQTVSVAGYRIERVKQSKAADTLLGKDRDIFVPVDPKSPRKPVVLTEGLHREFARRVKSEATALSFCNEFGSLEKEGESVSSVVLEAALVGEVISRLDTWRRSQRLKKQEGRKRHKDPLTLSEFVENIRPYMQISARIKPVILPKDGKRRDDALIFQSVPNSLRSWIWFKVLNEISGGEWRQCENPRCKSPSFWVDRDQRKKDQRFCSASCRVTANRLLKIEKE